MELIIELSLWNVIEVIVHHIGQECIVERDAVRRVRGDFVEVVKMSGQLRRELKCLGGHWCDHIVIETVAIGPLKKFLPDKTPVRDHHAMETLARPPIQHK